MAMAAPKFKEIKGLSLVCFIMKRNPAWDRRRARRISGA
jgi:hypothetical protein